MSDQIPTPPSSWAAPTPTAPETPRLAPPSGPPAGGGEPPYVSGEGAAPKPRRRRGRLLVAAVVAVAALGAGAFAVVNVGGSSSGSDSPDAAVRKLLDAASHEDVLGALDTLPPGERESFKQPLVDLVAQLKRLNILSPDAKLDAVKGAQVGFADVKTASNNVGDGQKVVSVSITGGKVTLGFDPAQIPLGDFLVQKVLKGKRPQGDAGSTTHTITGDENIKIATVKVDGSWYVSLWYTVAELARTDAGLPAPDFGHGIADNGAASPEAAVQELAKAAANLDVRRLIELTPPSEAQVLHDYGSLFVPKAEQAVADLKGKNNFTIDPPVLDVAAIGSGDRRTVAIKSATVKGTLNGDPFNVSFTGSCYDLQLPKQDEQKGCTTDTNADSALNKLGLGSLKSLTDGGAKSGIVVVQEDGKWYVSPTGTLTDPIINVLKSLDQAKLSQLVTSITDLGTKLSGDLGSGGSFSFGGNDGNSSSGSDSSGSETATTDDTEPSSTDAGPASTPPPDTSPDSSPDTSPTVTSQP
jgi:hypothetical protein